MNVVAVVHPTTLVAKELRELLEARPELARELRLLSNDEDEIGTLTEIAGAAAMVGRLEEGALDGVDLALFCGSVARDRDALAFLPARCPAVLLSRGATVEDGFPAVAGVRSEALLGHSRLVSPHPAAIALALLLDPLAPLAPRRAEATVLLPVSSADDAGLDELFEQTRGILAFQGKPKSRIFPTQIAFNLLPAAEDAEAVARLAAVALEAGYPIDLQLVQAGVFHGVAVALHVELERPTDAADVRRRIGRSSAITTVREPRRLGPVAAAGEEHLLLGEVRSGAAPGSFWVWAVMDNLVRGGAVNAFGIAEALLSAGAAS
jgi:aspartate-semialdehyde dehydrogenase